MRMAEPSGTLGAPREAVQPSLWDRLLNDLPGVVSEIDALGRSLGRELGPDRLAALRAGGVCAVDADAGLAPAQKERVAQLLRQEERRAEIEARGIVVSPAVLREAVRRDIEALFNTERFAFRPLLTDQEAGAARDNPPGLADFPEVARSVVNFGVPPFAGHTSRDFDRETLARELTQVLAAFEPRLKPGATKVSVSTSDRAAGLAITIDGLLIMMPAPERLRLRTLVDLESGRARTALGDA